MWTYVYGQDEVVADFVAKLIPELHGRGLSKASTAFGVIDDLGNLVAGIVYHNWDEYAGTIEMSGSSINPRWLTPETLRRMYAYPFLVLGCQLTYMRVAADNERLLRQLASINYTFIPLPRMLGRNRDGVLCQLTREAWEENKICRRYRHHELVLRKAA